MASLDTEIAQALNNFEAIAPRSESAVFEHLACLDRQYSQHAMYNININGVLVNIGSDLRSVKVLSAAVSRLKELMKENEDERFCWQLGNAYHNIGAIKCGYPPAIEELVDSTELLEARKWFSRVAKGHEFPRANTDSASILDTYSRNYEALLLYDRVLRRNPRFGMALGNKAVALKYFFDLSATGNPEVLLTARDLLKAALNSPDTVEVGGQQSADYFQKVLTQLEAFLNENKLPSVFKCRVELEELPNHIQFFKQHELFLNCCFKCTICEAGLKDSVFPALIEKLSELQRRDRLAYAGFGRRSYYCLKMLNHIFEDFAVARWLFFQAKEQKETLVELDDLTRYISVLDFTRNHSQFGVIKTVFAKLYGILDKVAYWVFFNYDLGRDHVVLDDLLRPEIKDLIVRHKNYQLLALYSLARDFMDGGPYNRLRRTRNHITHRFLDLGEIWDESVIEDAVAKAQFLPLSEFESYIFEMFSLVKAAVFYFLNGVRTDYLRELANASGFIPSIPATLQKEVWEK